MNINHINTFLAVVATGSFSAAARQLGKAQSAVSMSIAELEIDCHLQLFDRSSRYPTLTAAGERLWQQAQLIERQWQAFQCLAAEFNRGMEASLTLAVDDEGQLPWLAPILTELAEQFPQLELRLLFPLLDDLTLLLQQGRADLAISFQTQQAPAEIDRWPLLALDFVLVVAPSHPLAACAHTGVELAQLQQYRQILVTDRADGSEKQRGRIATQVWWAEGDIAVQSLVLQGLGFAFLPKPLCQPALLSGALLALKLFNHVASELSAASSERNPSGWPGLPLQLELWQRRGTSLGQAGHWLKQRLIASEQVEMRG
jgi:DNA-binding transcriptional LysR family regulator